MFTDLNVAGNFKISGDLTVTGDDITLGTNTAGHLLVADGTNYNPVALSNDATIASNGAITIADAAVSLDKLAANCINTSKIISGAVTNAEIGSGAAIDATKIADGSVSSAEFQHLNGVTSAIQTQIDTKTTIASVYPVGSIYINATNSTNPGTLLGFGTWVAFGSGRVMVGLDSSDGDFNSAEETGGSKTHTLTTSELPSHSHSISYTQSGEGGVNVSPNFFAGIKFNSTGAQTHTTNSTGSGSAHNNVQPYIVVYMWKRTA